jgi:ABC-2 type transport system ATP-binding protein
MSEVVLETHNLTKRFGDFLAVHGVTFSLHAGEVVGYLGPNGSGKTTTIRMLLGLLEPSEGEAYVLGYDVRRQAEAIRRRVGYMSQKFSLYHELTVRENLAFYAGVYGVRDGRQVEETIERVGLRGWERARAGELSTGWRQRLALAAAIIHRPRLLFLDEPTSGVDPAARREFWDLIYSMLDQGVTVLVTTHYMDEAAYCQRVGIMRRGRLMAMDTPQALQKRVPGEVLEIQARPLLPALVALRQEPRVLHARLAGDHLSALVQRGTPPQALAAALREAGLRQVHVQPVEPTLEDVFLAFAATDRLT